MKKLADSEIQSDLKQRFEFLSEFMDFGKEDRELIQQSAPYLGPKVPEIVDHTYRKLLNYDVTAVHFVPRQHGFPGECPVSLEDLAENHPQIQFRKDHLNRYLVALFTRSFDAKFLLYLDMVGKIHTPKAGNSKIHVPHYQMNALMGLISDALTQVLAESKMEESKKLSTIRAFQKLLWIQNDMISKHYSQESEVDADG